MSNFIHPFLSKTEDGLYEFSVDNDPDSLVCRAELNEFEARMFNEVLRKFSRNEKPLGPFAPHIIFTKIKGGK